MPLFFFPSQKRSSCALSQANGESRARTATAGYSPLYFCHVPFYPSVFQVDMPVDLPVAIRRGCRPQHHRHGQLTQRPRHERLPHLDLELLKNHASRGSSVVAHVQVSTQLTDGDGRQWSPPHLPVPCEMLESTHLSDRAVRHVEQNAETREDLDASTADLWPVLTLALPSPALAQGCCERDWMDVMTTDATRFVEIWRRPDHGVASTEATARAERGVVALIRNGARWRETRACVAWHRRMVVCDWLQTIKQQVQRRDEAFCAFPASYPVAVDVDTACEDGCATGPAYADSTESTSSVRLVRVVRDVWSGQRAPKQCVDVLVSANTTLDAAETAALWYVRTGRGGGGGGEWLRALRHPQSVLELLGCTSACPLLPVGPSLGVLGARPERVSLPAVSAPFVVTTLRTSLLPGTRGCSTLFSTLTTDLQARPRCGPPSSARSHTVRVPCEATSESLASRMRLESQRASLEDTAHETGSSDVRNVCDELEVSHAADDDVDVKRRLWQVRLSALDADTSVVSTSLLPFVLLRSPDVPHTVDTVLGANFVSHWHADTSQGRHAAPIAAAPSPAALSKDTPHVFTRIALSVDGALSAEAAVATRATASDPALAILSPFSGFRTSPLLFVATTVPTKVSPSSVDTQSCAAASSPPAPSVYVPTLRNLAGAVLRTRWPCLRRWHRYVLAPHALPQTSTPVRCVLSVRSVNRLCAAPARTGATQSTKCARSPGAAPPRAADPLSQPATRYLATLRHKPFAIPVRCTKPAAMATYRASQTQFIDALLCTERDPYDMSRSLYAAEIEDTRFALKVKTTSLLLAEKAMMLAKPTMCSAMTHVPRIIALPPQHGHVHGVCLDVNTQTALIERWVYTGIQREGVLLFRSYFYDLVEMTRTGDQAGGCAVGCDSDSMDDARAGASPTGAAKPINERLWMSESDDDDLALPCDQSDASAADDGHAGGAWFPSLVASARYMSTCQSQPRTCADLSPSSLSATSSMEAAADRRIREARAQGWPQLAADLFTRGPVHPLFRRFSSRAVVCPHAAARLLIAERSLLEARRRCYRALRTETERCGARSRRRSRSPSLRTGGGPDEHDARAQTPPDLEDARPPRAHRRLESWLPLTMQTALAHCRAQYSHSVPTEPRHSVDDSTSYSDTSSVTCSSDVNAAENTFARLLREWEEAAATRSLYDHAHAQRDRPRASF